MRNLPLSKIKRETEGLQKASQSGSTDPKPKAHILSGEELKLVHDLYHQQLHGHLDLIGFGGGKKKIKKKKVTHFEKEKNVS